MMRKGTWKRRPMVLLNGLLVAAFAVALLGAAAQKKGPAGSVLVPDKGKLNILLGEQSIGREEFEIFASGGGWTAKGTTKVNAPGATATTVIGSLVLQPDGAPVSYDWSSQAEQTNGAHIVFANGVAKITLQMQGKHPYEQDLNFGASRVVVLDNNLYYQYAVLARLFDWSKRGTQSFAVLIPQELTPGTISVDWVGAASAGGKTYEGLKVSTNDLQVMLYLDSNHRLMRLEVPAAQVAVVRE